jgi:hypothetical protein
VSISRYPIAFRPGLRPGADDAAVAAALLSGQAEADADTECASVFACAACAVRGGKRPGTAPWTFIMTWRARS